MNKKIHRLIMITDGTWCQYKGDFYYLGPPTEDYLACYDGIDEIWIWGKIKKVEDYKEIEHFQKWMPETIGKKGYYTGIENHPCGYIGYIKTFSMRWKGLKGLLREPALVLASPVTFSGWMSFVFFRRRYHIYIDRMIGDPQITSYNGKKYGRIIAHINRVLTHLYHKKCSLCTYVSKDLYDRYHEKGIPFEIWNDFSIYKKEMVKSISLSSGRELKLLYTGRLSKEKGILDLIEAVGLLKERHIKLTIIGDGEERQEIEEKVKELCIESKVIFKGFVRWGSELFKCMARADILVLPSYSEGLPMVVLEAMANGTTVIGSRVGGIPEIIHDGKNGLLFMAGSVKELSRKIDLLYQDRVLLRMLSENSLETARCNSKETQLNKFHGAYMKYVFPKLGSVHNSEKGVSE